MCIGMPPDGGTAKGKNRQNKTKRMKILNALKGMVPYRLVLMRRELLPLWALWTRKNMKRKDMIEILHFHLVDHCNLNCRGCDNFSPLAPETYTELSVFEADCRRMAQLMGTKNRIKEIQLLGGEPLLHPQVEKFMDVVRRYFPHTPVNLVSNGLLLPRQGDSFWEACRRNNVHIVVTKYPVKFDYHKVAELVKSKGVAFSFYGHTDVVEKTMVCVPLDLEGRQDGRDSFLRCARANRCISLDHGKLYTCSLIPYVKYFNQKFGTKLAIEPSDYMDIHQADSFGQILDFTCKPAPFCRYCNLKGTVGNIKFGISRHERSEWTGEKN